MFRKLLRRGRTVDRDLSQTPIHVVEQIGPKRAKTPEGFLLCSDVPISRVGTMLYGPGETPIKAGDDGVAYVYRSAAELFSPETIASFNGKPVVDEHPDDDVMPDNWNRLSIGVVLNPRQGAGDDADVLLADLLITQKAAIRDVCAGKREVSAGYSADYAQLGPGRGEQSAIIGNHVALVEKGRCGPRCAIGDHSVLEERVTMGTKTVSIPRRALSGNPVALAVRKAFRDAENGLLAEMGEDPISDEPGASGDTHIHIHGGSDASMGEEPKVDPATGAAPAATPETKDDDPVEARFQSLEAGHQQILEQIGTLAAAVSKLTGAPAPAADELPPEVLEEKKGGEEGEAKDGYPPEEDPTKSKTGDSVALETSFQALVADAEILVPGFKVPTFDAKQPRKVTLDSMCAMRRRILDHVALTTDGAAMLGSLVDGPLELAKQTCQEAAILFKAAVAQKRSANNTASVGDAHRVPPNGDQKVATIPQTPAELNEFNRQYWAKKS